MYAIMSGEVRITRNGSISIQGWVASQFWHTVFFEDTFTIIYMRGLEIKPDQDKGRAQSRREMNRFYERVQTEAKEVGGFNVQQTSGR